MQSPAPSASGGASPPIALSPVERSAFAHLFNLADPERTGIVTGDAAVSFFAKSKLPPATLGQIWAMADSANNGFLTPPSFSIALRLIGHAQRGETITEASIKRPGPPPTMEGVNLPLTAQLTGGQSGGAATNNMPGVIEIKPEDRARYTRIFANSGPAGGLIDGDHAKEIFVKSKLPFDKLGAIWNLADTQARGALDLTDFIIAMHFIQNTMNGTLNSIPAALPPGLYEQAKGSGGVGSRVLPGSPLASQNTGGSASGFGSSGIPRQVTGSNFPAASAFQSPQQSTPARAASTAAWDVTPEEKQRADQFFDGLDASKQGRLDGAAVVPFFMQSKLTESVLAHVWDLSDITQSGTLSKDEFAVAMHLINAQLAGKPLPQELPSSLVPPSMRSMDLPAAVNPQQSDTQKDLFSLMDDDPPPPTILASSAFITPSPAAPVVGGAQSTFFGTSSPAQTATASAASTSVQRSAPGPFDDDFFGDSTPAAAQRQQPVAAALSPAPTGGSFGSAAAFRSPGVTSPTGAVSPSASTSRLGTAFAAAAPAAAAGAAAGAAFNSGNDQNAEFGNKSIQLQSTEKVVSDLQSKRGTLESSVATNASTIAELESRLATVRSQHETESKLVKDLEERQQKQNDELKTLREDVIREESELSALKAEKDELEQALMRDREDVRDMKKRMNDVQTETESLKEQLEKLRKHARQQKGLVAISKKQLATAEGEQDKVASEIEAVRRGELGEEEVDGHPAGATSAAAAAPTAAAESVTSPAASVRSYNPFDRFGTGATASPQPGTPASSHQPSVGTSLVAGIGAGAVLGGVAAAATAHHEHGTHAATQVTESAHQDSREADSFGGQQPDQQQHHGVSSLGFDDAFAIPGEAATSSASQQQHAQAVSTDFDDNFGDDFGASATAVPTTESSGPVASGTETAVDRHASELAAAGGLGTGALPAAERSYGTQPATEGNADSSLDGPFGGDGTVDDLRRPDHPDADEDSSDDDEEGPEDLDGYRDKSSATPVAGAAGRFPDLDASNNDATAAATSTSGHLHTKTAATVPGGLEDVTSTDAPALSAPVDPTAIGAVGAPTASTTSIAPVSRRDTTSSEIDASATSGQVQTVEADESHAGAGTAAAGGIGIAALAAGAGALTLGELGQGDSTPSIASPTDDNVPLSQLIGSKSATSETAAANDPASSPTLSTKTRRAPPPAPVRSATTLSTTSAIQAAAAPTVLAAEPTSAASTVAPIQPVADWNASTNPFGMDDFGAVPKTTTNTTTRHARATNDSGSGSNFDDFDSAFEDLGRSEAVPASAAADTSAAAAAPAAGFDDTFDNDFDFVPSFNAAGANEGVSRAMPTTTAAPGGNNAAFDDFDAVFDSNPSANAGTTTTTTISSSSGSVALPALGAAAGNGGGRATRGTAKNTTSGFSFEDAFDASSITTTSAAAPALNTNPTTADMADSAFSAGDTLSSTLTSPTAPVGTYAPPPGPPPGFSSSSSTSPPAVAARSGVRGNGGEVGSSAIEQAEEYTGPLPDDAGPVKQLCGMGFSRKNVIQALEKSNYRTEKALERLLASQ
ncbi:related to EDE1 protein involved in endocytosis [Melanopsichium pennsylvanicum]|uniref:Related to EDE1 protein involved in endocytosis n=2 Tax=Melanopsichium pennsylvanicum TaxID=63383 RepID=A0AAJ5C781_9BASI|nr:related to EDE1 protein involved in endocytosis [Melanopsichium pennsylvanicum 4]SNX86642.1 related to EDE1 protein involved in endocytosis [Melanopsichium pennsylvanicum]